MQINLYTYIYFYAYNGCTINKGEKTELEYRYKFHERTFSFSIFSYRKRKCHRIILLRDALPSSRHCATSFLSDNYLGDNKRSMC